MREKERLKQWRTDLQQVILEKSKEKREKNKKYSIPDRSFQFMTSKDIYHKKNGVWKQGNK
ncbi:MULTISPECIES: hypothetical protein [Bacillus]|uniref:hypothetical protein n=1 Tax=Bacillus TaxID=1386 RepID=UPI0004683BB0|nr:MULTISPECIES: hypothetical protein [Bacillus]MED1412518.1 hypothetical protein [Bacillus paramycoides]MED1463818.1 hypothetical protein [Bacillus paramycoides]MED1495415.1 hypothetical protein [Bacillus paramycoides]